MLKFADQLNVLDNDDTRESQRGVQVQVYSKETSSNLYDILSFMLSYE